MTRDEAERKYVELIMSVGNPRYFIYQLTRHYTLEDLVEEIESLTGETVEIEDEE